MEDGNDIKLPKNLDEWGNLRFFVNCPNCPTRLEKYRNFLEEITLSDFVSLVDGHPLGELDDLRKKGLGDGCVSGIAVFFGANCPRCSPNEYSNRTIELIYKSEKDV